MPKFIFGRKFSLTRHFGVRLGTCGPCCKAIKGASRSITRFYGYNDCGGTGGSIPDEIGELTALTYLRLFNVGHTGTVPSTIQFLTALTWLELVTLRLFEYLRKGICC